MFFGPKRSPRRPVMSSGTAYASRYAEVTHTTLSRLLVSGSSAALIAGFATETIVVSTRIMKNPMTSAQRAGHGLRRGAFGTDAAASVRAFPASAEAFPASVEAFPAASAVPELVEGCVIGVQPFGLRDS